jgi:uncharacterized protein YdaU (DUF1376 family)
MENEAKVGQNSGVAPPTAETADGLAHSAADEVSEAMTTPIGKRTPSPAFQFYPKEFLSSSKVLRMSNTEVGVYIKLLCLSWLDGSLPADMNKLAPMVGAPVRQFQRMWPNVLAECFAERNGRLTNPRLERVRRELEQYRDRQAANGAKGGRPPKAVGSSGLTHSKAKKRSASSSSTSSSYKSPTETLKDSSEASSEPPLFAFSTVGQDRFWELLPSHVAKWQQDYPGLDVLGECRRAHAWVEANQSKRKTARGMPSFLVRWLNHAVDRGGLSLAATGTEGRGRTGAPPRGKYDGIEV